MTSYAKNLALGPVAGAMTDKTKGSFGNRVDCAGANIKNNATAYLQSAGVLGSLAVGTKYAAKNPKGFEKIANKVATTLSKGFSKIANKTGKQGFKQIAHKIAQNPKATVGIIAGTLAAIALNQITHNQAYKAGQIDQKYTDKAQFQKTL